MRPDILAALDRCRQEGRRPRVYCGGPYRASSDSGIHRNCHYMWEIGGRLWAKGYAAMIPHMNTYHMDGIAPPAIFLEGDLSWLMVSDLMAVADTWRNSQGTRAEVDLCLKLGIPVLCEAEADALPDWM